MSEKDDGGTDGETNQRKLTNSIWDHMPHIWIRLFQLVLNEFVQYLVVLDEDTEVCYSLSYRNGDVPSVWTEVLNGRVRTFRDLNRICLHFDMSVYQDLHITIGLFPTIELNDIKELHVPYMLSHV